MTLTLGADHTIHATLGWHETDDAGAIVDQGTDTVSGSYTARGNRPTLAFEDDGAVSAVLDGDALTVTADGNVRVFRRR